VLALLPLLPALLHSQTGEFAAQLFSSTARALLGQCCDPFSHTLSSSVTFCKALLGECCDPFSHTLFSSSFASLLTVSRCWHFSLSRQLAFTLLQAVELALLLA
jgi:hypothetical protein